MQPGILLAALTIAVIALCVQTIRAHILGYDHAWGVRTQAAWHWRRPWLALTARLWPVDLVHFDIDYLKRLNSALGEARVNVLLHQALRGGDIYRLQHGDECIAAVPAGQGQMLALRLQHRLTTLPLTTEERAALGGPISATIVVITNCRRVAPAIAQAVARREALKRDGRRAAIAIVA